MTTMCMHSVAGLQLSSSMRCCLHYQPDAYTSLKCSMALDSASFFTPIAADARLPDTSSRRSRGIRPSCGQLSDCRQLKLISRLSRHEKECMPQPARVEMQLPGNSRVCRAGRLANCTSFFNLFPLKSRYLPKTAALTCGLARTASECKPGFQRGRASLPACSVHNVTHICTKA